MSFQRRERRGALPGSTTARTLGHNPRHATRSGHAAPSVPSPVKESLAVQDACTLRPRRAPDHRRRAGRILRVDDGGHGRRRRRLLAHQRPLDRGQRQPALAHRGHQLVRPRDQQLRAARVVGARLSLDARPDEGGRLQHDPPALQQPALRRRQHAQRHRFCAERRSRRPERIAGHGQDRRLRRRDRPAHPARPASSRRRRAVRTLVHRKLRRGALDPRLDDARGALQGQHHGDRRRPAQRAARRRVLGLRRHRPRLAARRGTRGQCDPRGQSGLAHRR